MKLILLTSLILCFFMVNLTVNFAHAEVITLDQFLTQVQKSNSGLTGAQVTATADQNASEEGALPFSPAAFASVQYTDDRRQTIVPIFEGTRTVTDTSQLGIKKLFGFGLQSQLYYGVTSNTIYGVSPALVPQTSLITSGLTLQVTQSLWQNGFGQSDQALSRAVTAQDLANSYANAYQVKTILADAESRYWSLVIAREMVTIQKKSSDRTLAIRDFNVKRVRSHLIDEADLLTSDAQAKSKQFDLKLAIDNERSAARAFNSVRGMDSDEVKENLVSLEPDALQSIDVPQRSSERDDVKAAEQTTLAVVANSEVATQKQKPSLNVVGTVSTNGLDPSLGTSFHNTLTANNPYYQVGLNFTVPLDFGEVSSVKRAYAEQRKGAELTYQRRLFDQENDWKDLVKKLQEAKERLALAVDVEKAQKLKFDHESIRQKQGVTTTYQVFQYDLDYLTSALNRVQTQAIILNLVAQMKTFRSGT